MYRKIASLLIFAIFCGWSYVEVHVKMRKEQNTEDKFWERETLANSVRRKPIDHLDYITIPDNLPTDLCLDCPEIPAAISTIEKLRGEKILNLTGFTNTDLKMEYGAPNITELTRCDQNFTTLVTTLQKWADVLMAHNYKSEAVSMLEYMVSIGADIGKAYRILGKYYLDNSMEEQFEELVKKAEGLRSLNQKYIVQFLKELRTKY